MRELIEEDYYDAICIDPSPGPRVKQWAKGKVKILSPSQLDTPANLKWRNATIAFVSAKISPAEWLKRTKSLRETYHFLTSPKTKPLRDELASVPVDPGGTYSGRSVLAEMLLLSLPGKPVLCSSDVYTTKRWPDKPGKFESWILAMNDYRGPMLNYRFSLPSLFQGVPQIVRADAKPGILTFRLVQRDKYLTFSFNNSFEPLDIPSLEAEHATIARGLILDGAGPMLGPAGSVIENRAEG